MRASLLITFTRAYANSQARFEQAIFILLHHVSNSPGFPCKDICSADPRRRCETQDTLKRDAGSHVFPTKQQLRTSRGRHGPQSHERHAAVWLEEVRARCGRRHRPGVGLWSAKRGHNPGEVHTLCVPPCLSPLLATDGASEAFPKSPFGGGQEVEDTVPPPSSTGSSSHPIQPPHADDVEIAPPSSSRPTSPETDPDPSKTVYCTKPYKAGVPLVQYALMIDAGSTGSRIHIYKFHNCGPSPDYEYEVFKQTNPGLSSYAGRPLEAAQSLDDLLDTALSVVPQALQSCTPVAVKATAGLRLLGAAESEAILEAVRHRLHEKYPFSLQDRDGVVIMDGKDEGVFAWITANYLLGTIRGATASDTPTYAVLDLGGASTQIVFKPVIDSTKPESTLEEGEHKYDLTFGGKTHVLYQHSYLGYGLMRARKSVHRLVDFMSSFQSPSADGTIANPCLAKGTRRVVGIDGEKPDESREVTMTGADVGSYEACNRVVQLVMAKDAYVNFLFTFLCETSCS